VIWSQDSSVGIATDYGVDGQGLIHGRGKKYFSSSQLPDRLWNTSTLLLKGHRGLSLSPQW
jgi:hypothetical protein